MSAEDPREIAAPGRVHIDHLIDPALLAEMVEQRYVNVTGHPYSDLNILNYGQRAQFDNVWNDATLQCRGLIIDDKGCVVARPFRKFFNLSQLATVPDGPFEVHEKMDGSLGIGYPTDDMMPAIATRGSFMSEQATWATQWLRSHPEHAAWVLDALDLGWTPLFEIIYPSNRIVVDYGERAELVLLTCIDILTGRDVETVWGWPGTSAEHHHPTPLEALTSGSVDNAEGYVLLWQCGTRAKVKFDEYVRLHRLLTGVNARTIWELLANGQSLAELIEVVPDEFYRWVHEVHDDLVERFTDIEHDAKQTLALVDSHAERRKQAEIIKAGQFPGVTFAMLDGKDYSTQIWRMIRPEASRPFRQDES
jgi:RNA ligase